jgi:hypothetical protein
VEEQRWGGVVAGKIPAANADDYMRVSSFSIAWLDDYTLWWVATLHHYWMHTGDDAFLAEMYPALRRVFEQWAIRKHNGDGLLDLRFGDWYWSFARQGGATAFNALYVNALRCGAEMAGRLGHTGDAGTWTARADSVRDAINAHLFDAVAGLYVDGQNDRDHFPLDANTLTVLAGVAEGPKITPILDGIESLMWGPYGTVPAWPGYGTWGHDGHVWVWYVQFEVEARFRVGDDLRALEAIRRPWGHMVDGDPGRTMWEFMMPDGTVESGLRNTDHAFSAGAAWLLSEYVAGIRPKSPGFAECDIIPHPGDLEWVECVVPSPRGPFGIDYTVDPVAGTYDATVSVPAGSEGRVAVPRLGGNATVVFDGETVWTPSGPVGDGYADGRYLYFPDVGPGEHAISASFGGPVEPTPTPRVVAPSMGVY